jgi:hypothetical protein
MICSGDQVNLTAAGADTYLWSTGDQVPSISPAPTAQIPTLLTYTVWGTNALSGCTTPVTQQVLVNPVPQLFVVANNPAICAGDQAVLSAFGANTYAWSFNNQVGSNITVSPTVTTQYVVNGSNIYGCSASYTQQITVKPAPTLSVLSSNPDACKDDLLSLTAFGGVSYQWMSNTSPILYQGPIINVQASTNTNFTVVATGANGCTGKAVLVQNISECTGIEKINGSLSGIRIYPNPTAGEFAIEFGNSNNKTVEVTDISGRVILSTSSASEQVNININNLASGVYYVKVQSENASKVVKVVKQ